MRENTYQVVDDFLSQSDYDELLAYINEANFKVLSYPDENEFLKKNNENNPKVSEKTYLLSKNENHRDAIKSIDNGQNLVFYPFNTIVDQLFAKIETQSKTNFYTQDELKDSSGMLANFYKYSYGQKLPWHDDGHYYIGGFIFYTVDTWEDDWDGQLLIKDSTVKGDGIYINPKPNRLVLIKTPIEHCVTPISTKSHLRTAFTGFFVKDCRINEMIQVYKTLHQD